MSTDDQTPSESTRTIGVTSLLPGRTGALRFMVPDALPEPSPSLANRRRLVIFVRHDGILAGRLGLAGGQLTAEWLVEERIAPPPATTGLDFGDLSTGSELPAVALMQSAIERLVANLPRHEGKAVLVLGGRFVRHSIETVPKTSKRVTQLALRRLFRVQPHEQISWQTLATSMNRGEPAITHQVFATDRALVLGILSSLQQANIAVTRTLPETALDAVCAVNYERFTTEGGAILIAMLTENRLCQTFVDQGRVLFVRRSAIHMDDRVDQRVAGEIQRTSVFFHRRFREYSVDRIQLMVTGTVDGPRFATAIAEKVAHELSWCKLHLERPADLSDAVNDADFLTMATTVFSDQEPQIAQWDLTPVEWRQRRGL
ncbi:MAG: hypothetical protein KDB53_18420, partial [Planctomycetes bacterium]|nr:hypothetical protein [Planctomycetota bacterium]